MKTLADQFKQSAALYGSKPCIKVYNPDREDAATAELTYEQFYAALRHRARQLITAHSLRQGDTIAILADNSLAYLILVYAAALAGIRVSLVSTKVLPEHLQNFLGSTACKLLFTSPAYEKLAGTTGCARATLATADLTAPAAGYAADAADAFAEPRLNETDCALIMHTSGTTSTPRLVYLSHLNILSNQRAVQRSVAEYWTGADSSLLFLPLFHGYTLLSQFLRNTCIGATTVLLQQADSLTAENLVSALERTRVTFFCCVPWMLKLIHDLILAEQKTGASHALGVMQNLNFVITGGAPLDRDTGAFFTANRVRIVTFFGLTEAAGFVMHSSFRNGRWDLLHPVADESIGFIPVAAGSDEHELVLRASPLVALTSDSARDAGIPPGKRSYSTSDIFRRTPEGWAYLGRNDQMYNGPHGEKINPLLFETELAKFPAVRRAYVNGEELLFNYALVELEPECADDAAVKAEVLAGIQTRINPLLELPARVYPNDVIILGPGETIPVTPKGTVNRKAAKALLAARINAGITPAHARSAEALTELVHRQIRAYLKLPPDQALPDNAGLLELGFDSLMILSLRNTLQQTVQLEIPLDLMLGFPTISVLVAALKALHATTATQAATSPRPTGADAGARAGQWARIPLEQVIFHTAHYTFPFPTYNVSMSLLGPQRLTPTAVEKGMQYLEARHEVLRSVYTPEGLFRIESRSFVKEAMLGSTDINGSHNVAENTEAQALIGKYLNCAFDLSTGPVYRYALINITNEARLTRTLVYVGLHHIAGDFKGFNALVSELMEYFAGNGSAPPPDDNYAAIVKHPSAEALLTYQNCWRQLLTVMPELKEGLDFRAGHRQYFHFPDVNLIQVAAVLRRHNISLYNGVYAIYAAALSRHLPNLSLGDFHTATAVTSRITAETENLMGCFIHSPLLRFHLDERQTMLQMMADVQRTTLQTFTRIITDPASYLREVAADPSNLVPFLSRNVFLYRSPDEIMSPLPGWNCYRNEFFFESCDVGMYLDFCANRENHAMEGYVLINLHYCEPTVIQPILDDIRTLLLQAIAEPELGFLPAACLRK